MDVSPMRTKTEQCPHCAEDRPAFCLTSKAFSPTFLFRWMHILGKSMESPFLWRVDYSMSFCLQGLPGHLLECRIIVSPRGVSPLTGITRHKQGLPRVQKTAWSSCLEPFPSLPQSFCISGQGSQIGVGWVLLLDIVLFVLCFGMVLLKVTDSHTEFLCLPFRDGICSHFFFWSASFGGSSDWPAFTWEVWGLMLQCSIRTGLFLYSGCCDQSSGPVSPAWLISECHVTWLF